MNKCKYQKCRKEFDIKEIKRIYGKKSSIALLGYCSATCYTKDVMKFSQLGKEPESLSIEQILGDLKKEGFCITPCNERQYKILKQPPGRIQLAVVNGIFLIEFPGPFVLTSEQSMEVHTELARLIKIVNLLNTL